MFDRLMTRTTSTTNTQPVSQPLPHEAATAQLQVGHQVTSYKPTSTSSALPEELNQLILDAGWVMAGRKVKTAPLPRPTILTPRLSVVEAYKNKSVMGFLRLPRTLTKELGWDRQDKICVVQHPDSPAHRNKMLLVKSGNNQGYVLNGQKNYPEAAQFIKFLWMQARPVLIPKNSYMECTYQITDKKHGILLIEFDDTDIKTEVVTPLAGAWAGKTP